MSRPDRVLAFVCAHPDDDVMNAAGHVWLRRDDPSFRFVLVIATYGEAGQISPGSGATRETLGSIRRIEDIAGWDVVGRQPDRREWLGLPDGGLADLPDGLLDDRIAAILAQERPDVVITFGRDGITGHPDHIAIGAATDAAFLRFAGDGGIGFRRLLHAAYPQSSFDRMNAWRIAQGKAPLDPTRVYDARGVPDEQIDCTVDLSEAWPTTREAMRAHRSQWNPPWSDHHDGQWRESAGAAHLVQAWPPRERPAPRMTDVFQGLG